MVNKSHISRKPDTSKAATESDSKEGTSELAPYKPVIYVKKPMHKKSKLTLGQMKTFTQLQKRFHHFQDTSDAEESEDPDFINFMVCFYLQSTLVVSISSGLSKFSRYISFLSHVSSWDTWGIFVVYLTTFSNGVILWGVFFSLLI